VSESSPSASAFSAAGPALGYLAQVDYALLAALERMDDEDDFAVSIETLDDIVFHDAESDDATAKWQSKHTIDRDRLRGWWHKRAIAHLDVVARGLPDRIGAGELESELLEIADALRDDNLPIDVLDMAEPTEQEVSESDRIFVAQLRLVALGSERLRKCIYDHDRAFAQRSRWQRDRLLEVGELSPCDRDLKEAWERYFLPVGEDDDEGLGDRRRGPGQRAVHGPAVAARGLRPGRRRGRRARRAKRRRRRS
jgi:hypothetical protein